MMQTFRTIAPEELGTNFFSAIGKGWMLVTAQNPEDSAVNMMTASWGGTGILWGKPVAFVFLRPQRFTRELVDATAGFSLAFLGEEHRSQLSLCGSKSGRDLDKVAACGFDIAYSGAVPYVCQAHTVLVCNKLYRQPLEASCFLDPSLAGTYYPGEDYHILYVAEITDVLTR